MAPEDLLAPPADCPSLTRLRRTRLAEAPMLGVRDALSASLTNPGGAIKFEMITPLRQCRLPLILGNPQARAHRFARAMTMRHITLDHDDFGLNQSKVMIEASDISDVSINVIDCPNLERDAQISLRNLRKLDCAGKPVPTFPHPALGECPLCKIEAIADKPLR